MTSVWAASENADVRPSTPPSAPNAIAFRAGRNEFCSAQICIRGPATGVSVSVAPFGPFGARDIHLFRAAIMNLVHPSGPDGWIGPTFDGLIPDVDDVVGEKRNAFPFDVPSGESRVIWFDAHLPTLAKPGSYAGTAVVTGSGAAATIPISLQVLSYTLPSTATLRSYWAVYYGSLEKQHPGADITALRARYGALGLDHRISCSGFDDGNGDPWHIAAACGDLMDGKAPTQLVGAKMTSFPLAFDKKAMWAMCTAKGWTGRVFDYTADEPVASPTGTGTPLGKVGQLAKAVHAIDPAIRTLVTMTVDDAVAAGFDQDIDILCPPINHLNAKAGKYSGGQGKGYDAWRKGNPRREPWMYLSCMSHGCNWFDPDTKGWPTYSIDAPPLQVRAMPWLCFVFDFLGELYYATTEAFNDDPWRDQWRYAGNGDGTLFLPGTPAIIGGKTDIPCATIRLKRRRQGDQDAELLHLASNAGLDVGWNAVVKLWPTPYSPPTMALFEAERAALADAVDRFWAVPVPPVVVPPVVPPAPVIDLAGIKADLAAAAATLASGATSAAVSFASVQASLAAVLQKLGK